MLSTIQVPADHAEAPAHELGGRTRLGPLPDHRMVLYVKDLAITVVVLLALPYLVHKLVTRPGTVIGNSKVTVP